MATDVKLGDVLKMDDARNKEASSRSTKSAGKTKRTDPVRLTIDFDPDLHRKLKLFALQNADNAAIADVVRAMVSLMTHNKSVGQAVLEELDKIRS